MVEKEHLVLIIEDDDDIMELIRFNCERDGFKTIIARSAEESLRAIDQAVPSVILLDLMLPGIDGLALCKVLKSNVMTREVPIIIVSAKGEEAEIIAGLEQGAADYITKPFSPRVLIARLRAVMRRHSAIVSDKQTPLMVGGLLIHPGRREVRSGNQLLSLTATEFTILKFLADHSGWVFTRDQLVTAVHGPSYPVTERSIDVLVAGVRKKLGDKNRLIETVRGVGYRFQDGSD